MKSEVALPLRSVAHLTPDRGKRPSPSMRAAIRVDASSSIGTGHFMRCLTLADALRVRGVYTRFISRQMPEHLAHDAATRGHDLILLPDMLPSSAGGELAHSQWLPTTQGVDAEHTLAALSDHTWDWVIVDHYALDAAWEKAVRTATAGIFAIDDLADRKHDCDMLLDQNLYSRMDDRYTGKVPQRCRLLLGPRYALLSREFLIAREQVRPRDGRIRRLLVFFGGVDAGNHTSAAVEAVRASVFRDVPVDVIIGASHPVRESVEAACRRYGFSCHVQTTRMAELIAGADLAIAAGGAAMWERCCLGLPTLAFAVAPNQERQIEDAARAGLIYAPEWKDAIGSAIQRHARALAENASLVHAISCNGIQAVDGHGVRRVLRCMGCSDVELHEATREDEARLFAWRNDPAIRSVSRDCAEITWEGHQRWFRAVLSDRSRLLLIGYRDGIPVGVVRFDIAGSEADVSIYLVPGHGGRGTGSELLQAAERRLSAAGRGVEFVRAQVMGGNERSHRLFSACGYEMKSAAYTKRLKPK